MDFSTLPQESILRLFFRVASNVKCSLVVWLMVLNRKRGLLRKDLSILPSQLVSFFVLILFPFAGSNINNQHILPCILSYGLWLACSYFHRMLSTVHLWPWLVILKKKKRRGKTYNRRQSCALLLCCVQILYVYLALEALLVLIFC